MICMFVQLVIGKSHFIEAKFKGSPSDPVWIGSDDGTYPGAEGFVILRSYPKGCLIFYNLNLKNLVAVHISHFQTSCNG